MYTFVIVSIALIGLLMTIVILLQSGRGGGLAGIAAGESTRQVLGARQAPGLLEKSTWTLATVFIVLCVLASFAIDRGEQESIIQQEAQGNIPAQTEEPVLPGGGQPPLGQQQDAEQNLPPQQGGETEQPAQEQ